MFLDESGFLLIPNVRKTWAPVGRTPTVRHSYKRDKLSAISAVPVSPRRTRLGLYMHVHETNITGAEVSSSGTCCATCAGQSICCGTAGRFTSGTTSRSSCVSIPAEAPSIPPYAPELNLDEFVWTKMKSDLANGVPKDLFELDTEMRRSFRHIHDSQDLLWSCIFTSDLPW